MAAFSGTVILLAFKHQKPSCLPPSNTHFQINPIPALRPCLSSGEKKGEKKKKKVRFAEDVVDPRGNNEVFRRQLNSKSRKNSGESQRNEMPANRVALYKGILKDRVIQRMGYSY
ncbi:uncharacterized protein LOC141595783 [Silene latifolia]|uniref:uncharacterized protein LOC141595783 n=1 Tax=Silene latifolia TaxID=37657 RepID=UPI003D7881D5